VAKWTVTQWTCLVLGGLIVLHNVGGMITNPDFSVGDGVTAVPFLGLDYNGWHALSGLLLFGLGMVVSPRADLARTFAIFVVVVDVIVGIWILITPEILGILYLPTTINDVAFHFGAAVLFALALAIDASRESTPA
jgi:hypothetical protein